tara:strand:+ start:118 stop:513 length:396 start_codon:yes stop_codon:yes gene_type:complete
LQKYFKKIIAQNPEDLKIISALCSEAEVNQKNIKFLKKNKIFLMPLVRIDRENTDKINYINSMLKFEYISVSKSKNINQDDSENILKLMLIDVLKRGNYLDFFLIFDKNKIITLTGEVTEVILEDLKQVDD